MPNGGHRWTKSEEKDAVDYDWTIFSSLYPAITKDAYRIRRNMLLRNSTKPTKSPLRAFIHRLVCGD